MRNKKALMLSVLMACSVTFGGCAPSDNPKDNSLTQSTTQVNEENTTATPTEPQTKVDVNGNILVSRPKREEVSVTPRPVDAKEQYQISASEATLTGNCTLKGDCIEGIKEDGDTVSFKVDIESGYFFDISVAAKSSGGTKYNNILVDGQQVGTFMTSSSNKENCTIQRVFLDKGVHTVTITKSWGWISIYGLELNMSQAVNTSMFDVPATLIDEKASANTKRLMSYLTDIYGRKILTGQYYSTNDDIMVILGQTKERPAVWGLDLMDFSTSRLEHEGKEAPTDKLTGTVKFARDMYQNTNAIITFCWHWTAPTKYLLDTKDHPWYSGFYADATNINLKKIMDGQDKEGYDLLLKDIDAIAAQLKLLEAEDVPILFRPLHEASGGWFWWGASGADSYKKLWILLYDRLTNYHDIHNLIWVWNGQAKDWYPGDEYVDIIGEDIYPGKQVSTSQASKFFEAADYTNEKKMIVLSENGCIPDPDLCIRDGAMWGFYATWSGEFVRDQKNDYSEEYTTKDILLKMYSHEKTVTLQELPDLKNYPIYIE